MTIPERNPLILLPYDFSEVSKTAARHAMVLAKLFGYRIMLLNTLDKGTRNFLRAGTLSLGDLEGKLSEISVSLQATYGVETSFMLRKGSLKRISKVAEKEGVSFIVMGVEEPRGYSTPILKVICKSPVPVFVIQQQSEAVTYRNILFPLDDFPASRQKVGWAARLAQASGARINVFSVNKTDKDKTYEHIKIIEQVESFFAKRQIQVNSVVSDAGMREFSNELLQFGSDSKCDSLVILLRAPKMFRKIHPIDKRLMFNEDRMPVLCINLRDVGITGGFS